jgi:hypothetical protein
MRLPAILLLAAATSPALALDCGAVVDRDVVLDADLDCPHHAAALRVARDGVRIDLAGHAIRGDADGTAIALADVSGARIHGPGRIEGVRTGVEAERVRGLTVAGVDFVGVGEGVRLTNARNATVVDNRFRHVAGHAVVALSLPYALSAGGGHVVEGNVVVDSGYGVLLGGGRGSRVAANRFEDVETFAVQAYGPAHTVTGNDFDGIGVAAVVD